MQTLQPNTITAQIPRIRNASLYAWMLTSKGNLFEGFFGLYLYLYLYLYGNDRW